MNLLRRLRFRLPWYVAVDRDAAELRMGRWIVQQSFTDSKPEHHVDCN